MPRADPQLRALRRELLLTRAALEREELLRDLHLLHDRARPARMVANAAASGWQRLRSADKGGYGSVAVRVLARNPWLVASLLAALRRGRLLKLGLLGAAAGAAWWWFRQRSAEAEQPELPFETQELDDLGI